jgi:predicted XRE-type DNA-binding protein
MANRRIDGIEVEASSGNVFADLGLPDAEQLKIKSGLVIEIIRAVRRLGLTQEEAGRRMGISQAKVSGMMRGDFSNLSEQKLMECLNRLGYDIEIKLSPAAKSVGRRKLAQKADVSSIFDLGSSDGSNIAVDKDAMIGEAFSAARNKISR